MAHLSIRLFGPPQFALDGEAVTDFATDKVRALLAYLALETSHPHHRGALAGLLWPEQPERKARQSLRQALATLRRALGERGDPEPSAVPFLHVTRETIQFNADSDHWLDTAAFATLIEACKSHRHRRLDTCRPCILRLAEAVTLYRGSFVDQFYLEDSALFEEWASLKRESFRLCTVEAFVALARYYERRGDLERAQDYARRQVELEPWNEESHRQLMGLLALDGQRSAALVQYETCRRTLRRELDVEPMAETVALYERIRTGRDLAPPPVRHNLPPSPTTFVGREEEMAELLNLLANPDCRLVTLLGPGGIGKSRLGLQVAKEQIGAFADGVHFVALASIPSAGLIVSAIADALSFPFHGRQDPQEQLLSFLQDKEMLLLLDNMEHILEGRAFLASLLKRAPGVVLLVTSRQRLNLQEEWAFELSGLTYPRDAAVALEGYSAIELFFQRARQANRLRSFSEEETPAVVHICRLVEGMPLAIELAVACLGVRSGEEIAREIEHNLDVLATSLYNVPERHRSMRATFEHSWGLLSEQEQRVFKKLSVFGGGFNNDASQQVVGASPDVLMALLDKSFLRREGTQRYQVHQLLQQYAAEKLDRDPQMKERVQGRHASYYAAFLQQREGNLKGAEQPQALAEIRGEMDNVRAAWKEMVVQGRQDDIEQALGSLALFYEMQGMSQEGAELFDQAIAALHGAPGANPTLLGRLLAHQGAFACRLSAYDEACPSLEEALPLLGEHPDAVFALNELGEAARLQGKYDQAEQYHQAALTMCLKVGGEWDLAACLVGLGSVAYRQGSYSQARQHYQQSLEIRQRLGDEGGVGRSLNDLGVTAYRMGEYETARQMLLESLAIKEKLQDRTGMPRVLNNLGNIADVLGEYGEAKRWYGKSLAIRREIGDRWGIALNLNNLGVVSHRLGNYEQARQFHQQSLTICQELDDQRGISNALNNLGLVAEALEDYAEAERLYQEALTIRETIGDQRGVGWSHYHLGVLSYLAGNPARAQEWLDSSLAIWHGLGDPWGLLFAMNGMGQTAIALGKIEQGTAYLRNVLQEAVSRRTVAVALRALLGWATCLNRTGRTERAAELFALIQCHPASEQQTIDQAARLRADLAGNLSPQQLAAAEERGRASQLEVVVGEILRGDEPAG